MRWNKEESHDCEQAGERLRRGWKGEERKLGEAGSCIYLFTDCNSTVGERGLHYTIPLHRARPRSTSPKKGHGTTETEPIRGKETVLWAGGSSIETVAWIV